MKEQVFDYEKKEFVAVEKCRPSYPMERKSFREEKKADDNLSAKFSFNLFVNDDAIL